VKERTKGSTSRKASTTEGTEDYDAHEFAMMDIEPLPSEVIDIETKDTQSSSSVKDDEIERHDKRFSGKESQDADDEHTENEEKMIKRKKSSKTKNSSDILLKTDAKTPKQKKKKSVNNSNLSTQDTPHYHRRLSELPGPRYNFDSEEEEEDAEDSVAETPKNDKTFQLEDERLDS